MQSCPTAALVIIGQELLSGKVADENVSFLTARLYDLGVQVKRVLFVSDETAEIVEAVRWVVDRHDHVITTGGLGPTHDDVTVAAVAEALGRPMVFSPNLEKLLESYYGLPDGPERSRLCRIPEGSELFYPEGGKYPQLKVGKVYLFPGVPAIVRSKFPLIEEHFRAEPIHSERLDLERPEIEIVHHLNAAVEAFPMVRFGSYPLYSDGKETVSLTLESLSRAKLEEALDLLRKWLT